MAQWTSEYAILQDLSIAQGRVPVAIDRIVGAGDKPPKLDITEETEEEFFKLCSGDTNIAAPPDLGLIQKMLDMVREVNDRSDDEDITSKPVVVTKFMHTTEKQNCVNTVNKDQDCQTLTNIPTTTPDHQPPKPKHKKQRNIAVESILQAIAENNQNKEIILRKPDDFITVDTRLIPNSNSPQLSSQEDIFKDTLGAPNYVASTPTPVEKVTGWFETQIEGPFVKKPPKVALEVGNITFKKKDKLKLCEGKGKHPKDKLKISERRVPLSSSSNSSDYKPSALAEEYYQKYQERNKFKENLKENIWSKAERTMKEIDEKRRSDVTQALTSPSSGSRTFGLNQSFEAIQSTDLFTKKVIAETKINRCLELVALSQHRHEITDNCIVCQVMTKKPDVPKIDIVEDSTDENNIYVLEDINDENKTDNLKDIEETAVNTDNASFDIVENSTDENNVYVLDDIIDENKTVNVKEIKETAVNSDNASSVYEDIENSLGASENSQIERLQNIEIEDQTSL